MVSFMRYNYTGSYSKHKMAHPLCIIYLVGLCLENDLKCNVGAKKSQCPPLLMYENISIQMYFIVQLV